MNIISSSCIILHTDCYLATCTFTLFYMQHLKITILEPHNFFYCTIHSTTWVKFWNFLQYRHVYIHQNFTKFCPAKISIHTTEFQDIQTNPTYSLWHRAFGTNGVHCTIYSEGFRFDIHLGHCMDYVHNI